MKKSFKIISIVNISNKDNLECDSGVHVQLGFGKEMEKRGHKYVIYSQIDPDYWIFQARKIELGNTKYAVRFGVPYADLLKNILKEGKVDFVLVNQPEIAASVKAILIEAKLYTTQIIIYVHYLPIYLININTGTLTLDPSLNEGEIGEIILSKVFEGCKIADKILVHSQWGADLLANLSEQKFGLSLSKKISIVPPPLDNALLEKIHDFEMPFSNFIAYPNRLYAHYGTSELFKQLHYIQKKNPFKVYVSDPLANQSINRKALDPESEKLRIELKNYPFILWGLDEDRKRSNYYNKLRNSLLVLAPNRKAALWSMSVADGMANARPALAPNAGGYKDLLPSDLLWNNERDLQEKLLSLLREPTTWKHYAKLCYSYVQYLNPSNVGKKLEDCLYDN